MDGLYNVGAYIRLSVEDSAYDSESVENQREMLSKFIDMMPGWIAHRFYVDNGYSGATFQRPAFQEMMRDVRGGQVNLVLVKDLSRFGRNYLEAGHYLEEELPALGCRFVALSDGIDTENGENDIMPFLNAMNDYYLKNLSDRIRLVLAAKARDGQKIAGTAPYGYWRNPEDHTRLIVDEYAAGVVRRIFEMRKQGMGYPSIAKALNSDGITSPGIYSLEKRCRDSSHIRTRLWIVTTVAMILKREAYIGTAEQLATTIVSYRDKRSIKRPVEERIRVENAYPAIIDRETWEATREVNQRMAKSCAHRGAPKKSLFSGLVVCAECGVCMFYWNPTNAKTAQRASYLCRTHSSTGGVSCSNHKIPEDVLKRLLLNDIRETSERIKLDENAMLESLKQRLIGSTSASKAGAKKETRRLEQELHKLQITISSLYEKWALGEITEAHFTELMQRNEDERLAKEQRLAVLEQTEKESASKLADIEQWMRLIRENASAIEISRELLEDLVEKIEIGTCGAQQTVRIYYRFVGLL